MTCATTVEQRIGRGGGRTLRGAAVMFAGQVCGQAASFARNLVVARMISSADFGIASTFAVTMSLLEMLGDLAVDKLLVQARDGDDPRVQDTAQFVQFVRGLGGGALLFVMADVVAALFRLPDVRWAFRSLAIVPVINGLAHLDARRFQRDMRFLPSAAVDALPQVAATLAAWPLALLLGDYRVVLWCALLQAAASTVLSHVLAERRYAWRRDRDVARRIIAFGWPLLVNAILMYAIFQGDRIVVGTSYSLADLGAYSLAFSIAFVPTSVVAHVATAVMLPLLSRAQDDPSALRARSAATAQAVALATTCVAIPLVVAGGPLIVAWFGTKYAAAASVMPWLAAMQGVRILRIAPVLVSLARADTVSSMMGNLWRSCALGAMVFAAWNHAALPWIAAAGLGGEVVALLYSVDRLRRLHGLPTGVTLAPSAIAFGGLAAALACASSALSAPNAITASLAIAAATVVAIRFAQFRGRSSAAGPGSDAGRSGDGDPAAGPAVP
jgi:O-antigen/teichoic acid export membrane protein